MSITFQKVELPDDSKFERHEVLLEGEHVGRVHSFNGTDIWVPRQQLRSFFGPNPITGARTLEDVRFLLTKIWER